MIPTAATPSRHHAITPRCQLTGDRAARARPSPGSRIARRARHARRASIHERRARTRILLVILAQSHRHTRARTQWTRRSLRRAPRPRAAQATSRRCAWAASPLRERLRHTRRECIAAPKPRRLTVCRGFECATTSRVASPFIEVGHARRRAGGGWGGVGPRSERAPALTFQSLALRR